MQLKSNIFSIDSKHHLHSLLLIGIGAILIVICLVLIMRLERAAPDNGWDASLFASCEKDAMANLKLEKTDVGMLDNISWFCFRRFNEIAEISALDVNRSMYAEQNIEDRVLMWMVVSITLSGVLLAGLQLFASFKLASDNKGGFEKDSVISLEKNKLSFRSAVTGLMILFISLLFFIIFVKYVYHIEAPSTSPSPAQNTQTTGPTTAAKPQPFGQLLQSTPKPVNPNATAQPSEAP
jgi:hypothetical protein